MDNDIEAETDTGCDSVTQTHSNTEMLTWNDTLLVTEWIFNENIQRRKTWLILTILENSTLEV